jgi:hypothetical protein
MPQRDYILRLIEQMGALFAALRNRILGREADPITIRDELGRVAGRTGFDLTLLRGFDADSLHMLVAPTGEVEPARCWMMAELLYLDGLEAHIEERDADARASLGKARLLYTLIEPAAGLFGGLPEAMDRLREIDERLGALRGG